MAETIPLAGAEYDKSRTQNTYRIIEQRLSDVERALYDLRTSYGTVSLGETTLTLVNGDQNNVAVGYATYARISGPTAAFGITGIAGGEQGRLLVLRNTTAYAMTLYDQSSSTASTDTNRIVTQTGSDFETSTTSGGSAILIYDATTQRWIVIAGQGQA